MNKVRISLADLDATCRAGLEASGFDAENAAAIAAVVCAAERDHCHSHGLLRMPGYVRSLQIGKSNGKARPSFRQVAPGVLRGDGDNGFAPLAHAMMCPPLAELAKSQGIAALALANVHHFAALWPEMERLTDLGVVAMAMTSAFPIVPPPGGRRPMFGTNPLAFGWPRADGRAVIFDMATAAKAHGEILIAERTGKTLPPGTIIDKDGKPSTNPADVRGGAILAFGGTKGALVSMMVELLSAALMGEPFSFETGQRTTADGLVNRGGQLLIAMDPGRFGGEADWMAHAEGFFTEMAGHEGVRLPSFRRYEARAQSLVEGVEVPADLLDAVRAMTG